MVVEVCVVDAASEQLELPKLHNGKMCPTSLIMLPLFCYYIKKNLSWTSQLLQLIW